MGSLRSANARRNASMPNHNNPPPYLQHVMRSLAAGAHALNSFIERLASNDQFLEAIENIKNNLEATLFWAAVEEACERSGYLPHKAVPFPEFYQQSKTNSDPLRTDFDAFLSSVSIFYEQHQEDILQSIEASTSALTDIDPERKNVLRETIEAHRKGLFRLTTRALLPEIERTILEDWMGKDKGKVEQLTEKQIRQLVNTKTLDEMISSKVYDLQLFGRLINTLYKNGSKINDFKNTNAPNRHAALHGWLPYNTKEHSLNSIIFTDYIYRLTPTFKVSPPQPDPETGDHSD